MLTVREATARLHVAAVGTLAEAGLPVQAVNPRQMRDFVTRSPPVSHAACVRGGLRASSGEREADAGGRAVRPLVRAW